MKIALVINDVLIGGAQAVVAGITAHLSNGNTARLYYLYDFPSDRKTMVNILSVTPKLVSARGRFGFARAIHVLMREFREERPDIVHCHLPDSVIVGGISAILCRIPFIMHEHQTHQLHSWKIRLAFAILRRFAAVSVCYGESIEREIARDSYSLDVPPDRIDRRTYTVLNGIDMTRVAVVKSSLDRKEKRASIGIGDDDVLLLSVGRLVEWKGHRMLTEAFAQAHPRVPALKLRIAGDGEQMKELAALIHRVGISDSAALLGARTDVYELLAATDIFSSVFTYPGGAGPGAGAVVIATYEAMGFGVPVINGDFAPAKAFFSNGRNALLVPPSPEELTEALVRLGTDRKLREELGRNAEEFAKNRLDWKKIVPIYERLYELAARR